MADDLDLEKGDPDRADAISAREQRRRSRQSGTTGAGKSTREKRERSDTSKTDGELSSRLDRVFTRIVEVLHAREDEELATAIDEDKPQLIAGFVTVTRPIAAFRNFILLALNLIELSLAFFRVGSILFRRLVARQVRKREEARAQQTPEPYREEWVQPEVVSP